jgi:hypothetical protein
MRLSDLEETPGSIVAVCVSVWALFVVIRAIISWLQGSDAFLFDANAALKGLLFAAVAWLGRERIDQVRHGWEESSGKRRIVFVVEVGVIALLVVIGINALADRLIHE